MAVLVLAVVVSLPQFPLPQFPLPQAVHNVRVAFYSPAPVAAAVTDLAALVMSRPPGDG